MAVYVYRSPACDCPDVEVSHPMSEDPDVRCVEHDLSMSRVPQAAATVLKGGGFYRTDSRHRPGVGDADRGVPPALPQEFGGSLDTRKR